MPRRGWHNEEWSRQWLQLLMGPRPPSVQWPRSRPRQPPKGSGKGRGSQSAPTQRGSSSEADSSHDTDQSCRIRVRSCSEVGQVGGSLFALDQEFPEAKYLKSVIDKTRVRAGHGHPGKRLDECQQYMSRAAKRSEIAKQAVVARSCRAGSSSRRVQHRLRKIGGVKEGGISDPALNGGGWQHGQNPTNSKPW